MTTLIPLNLTGAPEVYRVHTTVLAAASLLAAAAFAADTIRIAAQRTGTLAWELDVVAAHGLDGAQKLTIAVESLASPEAGKIALRGGTADIIVSDWLWVARERALGAKLVFFPYSSALGAVMVPAASPITDLAGLKGRKLAVAGGPIDKNWLLLQAAMRSEGLDLKAAATIVYGTPALLAEKALQGEVDATLNYWNFCAGLEAKGFRRLAGIEDILPKLGVHGRPALVGYVFDEGWAAKNRDAVARFLKVTQAAKDVLATSDSEWERLAPLLGARGPAALKIYRDRYREGIPRRPLSDEEGDARTLYRVLAAIGGKELVGPAQDLDPDTFYRASATP
jgi:NitT/TauT family transport system substrate-binding protein